MSSPFVAEIRVFGFNFAPTGWATCDGQLLPISQNTALFSLLGTFYGGDGKSTFALPNMQGNAPLNQGQGPGLSERFLGEQGGSQTTTLLVSEIPVHTHQMHQGLRAADNINPNINVGGNPVGLPLGIGNNAYAPAANTGFMAPQALPPAGSSFPHNNMMPYLTMNYCIAMQGVFPPRG